MNYPANLAYIEKVGGVSFFPKIMGQFAKLVKKAPVRPVTRAAGNAIGKSIGAGGASAASATPGIDRFVRGVTGKNTGSIMDRLIREGAHQSRVSSLKGMLRNNQITKSQFKNYKTISLQNLDGPGGYWKRVMRNAIDDVKHPIRNTQKYLTGLVKEYRGPADGAISLIDQFGRPIVSGQMVSKTPWGVTKSVAGAAAFPVLFSYPVWKDKELSTSKKIGVTAANLAIPITLHRQIPSLLAYNGADKLFRAPKKPVTSSGLSNL